MQIVTKGGVLRQQHVEELRASGLSDEDIARTGYWTGEKGELCITYYDASGNKCLGSDGKQWYRYKPVWDRARPGAKQPKYLSPKGQGCRVYHSNLAILAGNYIGRLADTNLPILITEGEKKTDCATAHGYLTLGLGGVSSWVDCRNVNNESRPLPELDSIAWQNRTVVLAFDSDFWKPQVYAELGKLSLWLTAEKGAHVRIMRLPTGLKGEKLGVDDLIVRYGVQAFERLYNAAEPATKTLANRTITFAFKPEPAESSSKALILRILLEDTWAVREGYGLYQRQKNHWKLESTQPAVGINPILYSLMDGQGWQKRSAALVNSIRQELIAWLTVHESQWRPPHLLCFANGVYDTNTNQFMQEAPTGSYITNCLPFDWNPEAKCPTWEAFIHTATGGDQELAALVQAIFRYVLTPKDRTRPFAVEKAFFFMGRKGTGKGTAIETLIALVGDNNVGNASPDTFADASSLAALLDCTLGVDMDSSGFLSRAGTFNSVVSNEPVQVNQKYQPVLKNHRLGVVIVCGANDVISVGRAGAEGLERRQLYIPFNHRPEKPDPNLKAKLHAELDGIFQWAWQYPFELAVESILMAGHNKAVAETSVQAAIERNPIFQFLADRYPQGHPGVIASEFYDSYVQWAKANGHTSPTSQIKLVRELSKLGDQMFEKTRTMSHKLYRIGSWETFDVLKHLGIAPDISLDEPDSEEEQGN